MSKENALVELWHILYDLKKTGKKKTLFEWKHLHLRAVWQAQKGILTPENLIVIRRGKKKQDVAAALVDVLEPIAGGTNWVLLMRPLVGRASVPLTKAVKVWGTRATAPVLDTEKNPQLEKTVSFPSASVAAMTKIFIKVYSRGEPEYGNFMNRLNEVWKAENIGFLRHATEDLAVSVSAENLSMGITLKGLGYRSEPKSSIIKTSVASGTVLALNTAIAVHYSGFGIASLDITEKDWVAPLGAMFLDTLFLDFFSLDFHPTEIPLSKKWPEKGALASFFKLPGDVATVYTHKALRTDEKLDNQMALEDVSSYRLSGGILKIADSSGAQYSPLTTISFLFDEAHKTDLDKVAVGHKLMNVLTGNLLTPESKKAFKELTSKPKKIVKKPKKIDKETERKKQDEELLKDKIARSENIILLANNLQKKFLREANAVKKTLGLLTLLSKLSGKVPVSKHNTLELERDFSNMLKLASLSDRTEDIEQWIVDLAKAREDLLGGIRTQSLIFLDRDYKRIDVLLGTLKINVDNEDEGTFKKNEKLVADALDITKDLIRATDEILDEKIDRIKQIDLVHKNVHFIKAMENVVAIKTKGKEEAEKLRKEAEVLRLQKETELEEEKKREEAERLIRLQEEKKRKEEEDRILFDEALENRKKVEQFLLDSKRTTEAIEASLKTFSTNSTLAAGSVTPESQSALFLKALNVIGLAISVTDKNISTGLKPEREGLTIRYDKMVSNFIGKVEVVAAHTEMETAWDNMFTEIRTQSRKFLDSDFTRIKDQQKDMLAALEEDPMNTGEFETNEKKVKDSLVITTDILYISGGLIDKRYAKTNDGLKTRRKALQRAMDAKKGVVVDELALKTLLKQKQTWEAELVEIKKLDPLDLSKPAQITAKEAGIKKTIEQITKLEENLVIEKEEEKEALKALEIKKELKGTRREILYGSAKRPIATILYMLGSRGRIDAQRIREDPIYTGSRGPEVANLSNLSLEFYGSSASALASQLSQNASIRAKNLIPKAVTADGGRLEQTDFDYYYGLHWVDDYAGFETSGGSVTSSPGNYVAIPDRGALLYHLGATKVGSLSYDFGNMVNQVPLDNPDFEVMLQIPARQDAAAPLGSGAIILGLRMPDSGNGFYSVRSVVYAPNLVKM